MIREIRGLESAARDKRRQLLQRRGTRPEWRQRGIRGRAQLAGELTRAVDAAERHERRLLEIRARDLARFGGIAFDVEQVVDDLEREPEILRVRLQRGDLLGGCAGRQRAGDRRGAEEGARLAAMNPLERLEGDLAFGRE